MLDLSSRLHWIVENRGMSMRQLGLAGDVSASLVSTFLRRSRLDPNADIGIRTLQKLAAAADVSLVWLATGEGTPDDCHGSPLRGAPKLAAALHMARVEGSPEEALWDAHTYLAGESNLTADEYWTEVRSFLRRWKTERARFKPADARDVTLEDIKRRWPTRWSTRAYELAASDPNPPGTWDGWLHVMRGWQRQAQRTTAGGVLPNGMEGSDLPHDAHEAAHESHSGSSPAIDRGAS